MGKARGTGVKIFLLFLGSCVVALYSDLARALLEEEMDMLEVRSGDENKLLKQTKMNDG